MAKRRAPRRGVVKAADVRPGDILWSDLRGRLLVIAVEHVPTREMRFGAYTGRTIMGVRVTALPGRLGAKPLTLGTYRPESELQLVRRARPGQRGGGVSE